MDTTQLLQLLQATLDPDQNTRIQAELSLAKAQQGSGEESMSRGLRGCAADRVLLHRARRDRPGARSDRDGARGRGALEAGALSSPPSPGPPRPDATTEELTVRVRWNV